MKEGQHRRLVSVVRQRATIHALALYFLLAFLSVRPSLSQTYTALYPFTGPPDAAFPDTDLIRDEQGNLYGTTLYGGYADCYHGAGCGTVFRVDGSGNEAVLYAFCPNHDTCPDGAFPDAALIRDHHGNLYGTTTDGGAHGYGTVYKIGKNGAETVLYSFAGGSDGASPQSNLVRDAEGDLFGTTGYGGGNGCTNKQGCGTVFKLTPSGKEIILYRFKGSPDGSGSGNLIRDRAGNLYGVAGGGAYNYGVVFKLSERNETILYSFKGSPDGSAPESLIRDTAGNFYGNTRAGGQYGCYPGDDCGVIFRLGRDGKETVLYAFLGESDGGNPVGGVVRDHAGALYGVTNEAGTGAGVIYELSPAGNETVLYTFQPNRSTGANPIGGLIADGKGNLYGTTAGGGDENCEEDFGTPGCGVVFKFTPDSATQ